MTDTRTDVKDNGEIRVITASGTCWEDAKDAAIAWACENVMELPKEKPVVALLFWPDGDSSIEISMQVAEAPCPCCAGEVH